MKLRLSILLLAAAALAAAPAAGQTIKSLGYNTTNGNIVAATNVTFTNSVGFATNARATTRTNLGLGGSDNVSFNSLQLAGSGGLSIGGMDLEATNSGLDLAINRTGTTQVELKTNGLVLHVGSYSFSGGNSNGASTTRTNLSLGATWLTNTSVANFRTAIGLGASNDVVFNSLELDGVGLATDESSFFSLSINTNFGGIKFVNGTTPMFTVTATSATFATNVTVAGSLTATGNVTMSGVGNTAPSQTADSASSLMTRGLSDARYGGFPSGQTVSVFNDVIYSTGATRGSTLRGTIPMPSNNTEYQLFNTTALGVGSVGHFYVSIGAFSGGVGAGNITGFMQGNQGDSTALATRTVFNNSTYWVSFTAPTTLTTGDTITGDSTGATAKVWVSSVFTNQARNDVWLYDVTGIFTSADTNISRNGTPTGNGIANSVWGASPSTNNTFFIYRTRSTNSNSVNMPAIFNRYGTNLTALFKFEAL
jgi:hypothetical protein